jgi:hypothetical protein
MSAFASYAPGERQLHAWSFAASNKHTCPMCCSEIGMKPCRAEAQLFPRTPEDMEQRTSTGRGSSAEYVTVSMQHCCQVADRTSFACGHEHQRDGCINSPAP